MSQVHPTGMVLPGDCFFPRIDNNNTDVNHDNNNNYYNDVNNVKI